MFTIAVMPTLIRDPPGSAQEHAPAGHLLARLLCEYLLVG